MRGIASDSWARKPPGESPSARILMRGFPQNARRSNRRPATDASASICTARDFAPFVPPQDNASPMSTPGYPMIKLSCLLLASLLTARAIAAPLPVIFDTDMDSDVDDVAALAQLHVMADRGEIELLAVMVSGLRTRRPADRTGFGQARCSAGQPFCTGGLRSVPPRLF
ncbi:MAG: nucleoside hydrolase [Rariglobus sp.]|nr:nucleoside hydrolase [Rariglobus sp.]